MSHIVLLGTCDTKLEELLFLRSQILECGGSACKVTVVDVGRTTTKHEAITIPQDILTTLYAPREGGDDGRDPSRGGFIKHMIACASNWLEKAYQDGLGDDSKALHGLVGAGGTGGTSLVSGVMRNVLPIGFPKLIVSTNASGDTGPVVGEHDITMTYSVVDIAGTNSLLRQILSNAAGAIVGMAGVYQRSRERPAPACTDNPKKKIGLTMFGVTTPCVDQVRQHLESAYPIECFVFHSTGHGGRAMERLIEQGELDAVLDITTTEICDHLCGGVMSAGPHRLEAALKAGIPCVISVGATDMVNFGPKSTIPERYQDRKLLEHNPTITLMRTSPQESIAVGSYIVTKIKETAQRQDNVVVALPIGGVSAIAIPDGPFYDPEADHALFSTIREGIRGTDVVLLESDHAVNEEEFARLLAERLANMVFADASPTKLPAGSANRERS